MVKYRRNKNTVASKLLDELVMIDVDLGKYFSLNPVASDIWEMMEQPMTKPAIAEKLILLYEIDLDMCMAEVDTFIEELMNLKLISKVD